MQNYMCDLIVKVDETLRVFNQPPDKVKFHVSFRKKSSGQLVK